MKDIVHYFGQSPKGDESFNSAKENVDTADSANSGKCSSASKSHGVLQQKASDTYHNIDAHRPPNEESKLNNRTPKPKSRSKKKSPSTIKSKSVDEGTSTIGESDSRSNQDITQKSTGKKKKKPSSASAKSKTNGMILMESDRGSDVCGTTMAPLDVDSAASSFPSLLISPKPVLSPSTMPIEIENDSVAKPKTSKNITHFFSPSKPVEPSISSVRATVQEPVVHEAKEQKETTDGIEIIDPDTFKKNSTGSSKTKRSSSKRKGSLVRKEKSSERLHVSDTSDLQVVQEKHGLSNLSMESKSNLSKSSKRVLSLSKKQSSTVKDETESSLPAVHKSVEKREEKPKLALSIGNAFGKIMSKSLSNELGSKENAETSISSEMLPDRHELKNESFDSPVKATRGFCRKNYVDCDSDDDVVNKTVQKKGKTLDQRQRDGTDCEPEVDAADTASCFKSDDSKRNSLMKYFQKVSKEEALSKTEKVEVKVMALVHSPPATPSKREKSRRSLSSVPSRAASSKRKGKSSKVKAKDNIDAIDLIGVEEIRPCDDNQDKNSKTKAKEILDQAVNEKVSSNKSKKLAIKTRTSPRKGTAQQSHKDEQELSVPNIGTPSFTVKALTASTSSNKQTSTKSSGKKSKLKSTEKQSVLLDNVKTSAPVVDVTTESANCVKKSGEMKTPPPSLEAWTMRVRLTPHSQHTLPTSQGTMHEEESEDEDIFPASKKKKEVISIEDSGDSNEMKEIPASPEIVYEQKNVTHCSKNQGVKIAPLFSLKANKQARQQFLQSGVPEQVKKMVEVQRSFEEREVVMFPRESHIQQINKNSVWNLSVVELPLKDVPSNEPVIGTVKAGDLVGCVIESEELKKVICVSDEGPRMRAIRGFPTSIIKPILRRMRNSNPDFKVVNTFKVLRAKVQEERSAKAAVDRAVANMVHSESRRAKRRSTSDKKSAVKPLPPVPSYSCKVWTEKYKPTTESEIIGNSESVQRLKRWLEAWRKSDDEARKQTHKEDAKKAFKKKKKYDDDDFLVSDASSDGSNSSLPLSTAVLYGPSGSGKTCSVYALAKDLGYKVLEVNASERRNGKVVLSKLSEATQSHQVQQVNNVEQGYAALFGSKSAMPKSKKPKLEEDTNADEDRDDAKSKKMSLILFEDVDIIFEEEDEGFLSAVVNLVSSSKRPVILTTTDPESSALNRFFTSSSLILQFSSPQETMCLWLQLVSLLEGVYASANGVQTLVSLCNGDFRRALLQMQLWVSTGGNNLPTPALPAPVLTNASRKRKKGASGELDVFDDDDGNMFIEDGDDTEANAPSIPENPDCVAALLGRDDEIKKTYNSQEIKSLSLMIPHPLNLGVFWWNLPALLKLDQITHAPLPSINETTTLRCRSLLNDSFIASFCSEDESSNGPVTSDNSNIVSSHEESHPAQHQTSGSGLNVQLQEASSNSIPYKSCCSQTEMNSVMRLMLSLSSIDLIASCSILPEVLNSSEPVSRFSHSTVKDSLSLTKAEQEGPNCLLESVSRDLCHWLAQNSVNESVNCLLTMDPEKCCLMYDPCLPTEEEKNWRTVHELTEVAVLQAVPLSVHLEKRSISTDYFAMLQNMCRLEKERNLINNKRRNRFYHYLKGIGAHLTESQLELLCQTLFTAC